jgi:hypothetical protein
MSQITLTLSLEQTNTILEALGQLPYVRVYQLIDSIGQQAQSQIESARAQSEQGERGGLSVARSA